MNDAQTQLPTEPLGTDEVRARRGDPDTSHAAAASVSSLSVKQAAVLQVLRHGSGGRALTDEQLVAAYRSYWHLPSMDQSESGIRTRRCELTRKGYVEWTGEKVKMSTGRMARTWRAVL